MYIPLKKGSLTWDLPIHVILDLIFHPTFFCSNNESITRTSWYLVLYNFLRLHFTILGLKPALVAVPEQRRTPVAQWVKHWPTDLAVPGSFTA